MGWGGKCVLSYKLVKMEDAWTSLSLRLLSCLCQRFDLNIKLTDAS